MNIRIKKAISYFLSFVFLLCAGIMLSGCGKKANSFSEEEHIQRISERIEKGNLNLGFPEGELIKILKCILYTTKTKN